MEENKVLLELIKEGKTLEEIMAANGVISSNLDSFTLSFIKSLFSLVVSIKDSVDSSNNKITQLTDQSQALTEQVQALVNLMQAKNKINITNSSIPPSKEGYSKPNRNRSLREPSSRKPGAQKGHKGNGLAKMACDIVDRKDHYPKECLCCTNFSSCLSLMRKVKSGSVYEVKTVLIDNEHVAYSVVCPKMNKLLTATMPEEVKSTQQYGNSIKGIIVDTWATGITSIDRLASLIEEKIGKRIANGTIMKVIKDFASKCGSVVEKIKNYITRAKVKGADETGLRTDGSLYWLHTICNEKATYLYSDKKRGFDAIENDKTLLNSNGALIHDCWSPYFKLDNLKHGICLQHIQRNLREVALLEKEHEEYFKRIEDFLLMLLRKKNEAINRGDTQFTAEQIAKWKIEFLTLLDEGLTTFKRPKRRSVLKLGKIPEGKARSLLLRLMKHIDAVFLFIEDFDIWFTNNCSEISFRQSKVRQYVSKCFRTKEGLSTFATIMSVFDTTKKNNINRMKMINAVLTGTADKLLDPILV